MAIRIEFTPGFARQSKRLRKKYPSWADDLAAFAATLPDAPQQGESLGRSCYKVRVAITSKGKGKRGGARVVTFVRVEAERITLLTVFDKADRGNLADGELDALLAEAGLE